MGSFAATCAISGLPIDSGDEIRIYLLSENPYGSQPVDSTGVWFPRTYPLRARYDDSGSVKDVEEGPARDVWLEGMKLDVVERERGDNTVRDVPVHKDMTWDEMMEAIWEMRLKVQRDYRGNVLLDDLKRMTDRHAKEADQRARNSGDVDTADAVQAKLRTLAHDLAANRHARHRVPDGVPTRVRIERALQQAGLIVHDKDVIPADARPHGSFFVNRVRRGCVRVRFHPLDNESFGKGVAFLEQARGALDTYVTAIVAGRGSSANAAELLVFGKPGATDYSSRRMSKKPLLVQMAMVREDIWQALLRVPNDEDHPATMKAYYDDIARYASDYEEQVKAGHTRVGDRLLYFLHQQEARQSVRLPMADVVGRNAIPFTVGLGTHWELMQRKGPIPPDFLKVAAEFAYIHSLLSLSRYYWRPGYHTGPQTVLWTLHQRVLGAMADVARMHRDKDEDADQPGESP